MSPLIADDQSLTRLRALQGLVTDLGRTEFDTRYPNLKLAPVVALICAYEEEDNLGAVLEAMPAQACGLEVVPVVIVDGGKDRTAEVARAQGAVTFAFPVNLGHGVALRVGYDLCVRHGAQYVVTLDADGQNDPKELSVLLAPLVEDSADFVVASRRLGTDHTADSYRRLGVFFFAWLMNRLNGTHLTDTSNGFRGLRVTMLSDIVGRLEQDQYQTAELITTAVRRGWRITERPATWLARTSGESKKGANFLYGFRYAAVLIGTWRRERSN